MADQEITIKISAKNLTSEEFAKARKEVAGLSEASDKASKEGKKGWKDYADSMKDVGVAAFQAGSIAVTALAGIAAGIAALGQRGADIADVRAQFAVLNGTIGIDSKHAIDVLNEAVSGTIPKFELMKTVNSALSQGMKVTADDYRVMGEVSRVLADRTGGDTATAFNTLTDAMASGKDMVLKTIGLNIDAKAATEAYAKSVGLQTADLNENQIKHIKQIAILTEAKRVLQESGKAQDDFGDSLTKVSTTFQNWLDDLSVGIAESPVLGAALAAVGDVFKEVFGGSNADLIPTIIGYIEQAALTMVEWGRTGVTVADYIARAFSGLQVVFDTVGSAVSTVASWFVKLVEISGNVGAALHIPGFADIAEAAKGAHTQLAGMAEGFAAAGGAALQSAVGTRDSNDVFNRLDRTLVNVRNKMVDALATSKEHTDGQKINTRAARDNADAIALAAEQHQKLQDVMKKFPSIAAAMAAEWDRITAENMAKAKQSQDVRNQGLLTNLQAAVDAERSASDIRNKRTMTDYEFQKTIINREAADKKAKLDEHAAGYSAALDAIAAETDAKMHQASVAYQDALGEMEDHTKDWSKLTKGWIGSIAPAMQAGFTGGGGMGGAMKSVLSGVTGDVGSKVGEKLAGKIGTSLAGKMGSFGPMAASALGGMATMGISLAAPLIIAGVKKIFNTSGRDAVKEFATGMGGFDDLHKKLGAMGAQGEELWKKLTQGVGRGNAKQAKEAIDEVTKAIGDYEEKLKSAQKAEEQVADRMSHLTQITPDLQAKLDEVYNAKTPEAYMQALQGVNGVMDQQDAKQKQLDSTLQKYGLSWTELGSSARAAKLGEIAGGLITDFNVLKEAGVDVNHIMEKMKPTLQDFVNQAKKTGTEVPESMKPVLQSAIDAGVLFDENGKKITDMTGTGLTFGQTMTQNFKDVSGAIEHLAQVLENQIVGGFQTAASRATGAINSIPTSRDFSVNGVYNAPDMPDGGGEPPPDMEGHAAGGLFSTPHIARIAEAGQPEIIGTEAFMARAIAGAQALLPAGALGGGGGTQVVFQLHTPLATIDTVRQAVFEEFGPAFLSWLEGNHAGSRTKLNQILAMGAA